MAILIYRTYNWNYRTYNSKYSFIDITNISTCLKMTPPVLLMESLNSYAWKGSELTAETPKESEGDPPTKQCSNCQAFKPIPSFGSNPKMKDGIQSWCRDCLSNANKKKRPIELSNDADAVVETPDATDDGIEVVDSLYVFTNPLIPHMVKIGRSFDPYKRSKQLGTSQPYDLMVCYTYKRWGFLERRIHDKLKHVRVEGGSGREWFHIEPEQANILIQAVAIEHELQQRSSEVAAK